MRLLLAFIAVPLIEIGLFIQVGGIIGLGVDAATGASKELTPNPVRVTLEC